MNEKNTYAVLAMCAIVIVVYALRNSESHYLPDLLGLALALAAPRQAEAIGAWFVIVLVRHTAVGAGLVGVVPSWLQPIALPGANHMSRSALDSPAAIESTESAISESESEDENSEIPQRVAENTPENINLLRVQIIAAYVISGEIGLTKAIQIGAGVKGGKKYQRLSRLVQDEIERQKNPYPAGSNLKRFE